MMNIGMIFIILCIFHPYLLEQGKYFTKYIYSVADGRN